MARFGPVPKQARSVPVKRRHGEPKMPDSGRFGPFRFHFPRAGEQIFSR